MKIKDYQLLALKIMLIDCHQLVERLKAYGLIYRNNIAYFAFIVG
jgi:hypothetical protein